MRQQHSCFFAAFFVALFLTFSLFAHSQPHPLSEIEHTLTEQHVSALANNNAIGKPLALSNSRSSFGKDATQTKKISNYHLESLWFNTLYRPLAVLEIRYQYTLDLLYLHQQDVIDNISEQILLVLGLSSPLYVDTSLQQHSL